MLIETLQLLRNQREQGFDETSAHENFSTKLGGYKTLRLQLKQDGSIHAVEPFPKEDVPAFWTLEKGTSAKAERFPVLRLTHPLLVLEEDAPEWKLLEEIRHKNADPKLVSRIRASLGDFLDQLERNSQDYWKAWEEKARPILAWNEGNNANEIARLKACVIAFGRFTGLADLAGRGKKAAEQRTQLAARVTECLIGSVRSSLASFSDKDAVETLIHLVVGKRVKGKGGIKINSAQLCIDYYDPNRPATIYTLAMHPAVKLRLPGSAVSGTCSLTGVWKPLLVTKFPLWDAKLFVKGIYSKNEAAPCNTRYDHVGLGGFAVSEQIARWMTSGLGEMTDTAREGKTWAKLYNGKFNKESRREDQDLLLAYPSFPVGELRTIDVFKPRQGRNQDDEAEKQQRFETLAESLCSRLRNPLPGSFAQEIPRYLHVLLVRKISEGQIQLVFSDRPLIEHFVAALAAWDASGHNLPPTLRVPLPSNHVANGIRWFSPRLLFPEEISRLLMHQWIRDGTECSWVEAPSIGMVLELFLRKPGVWQGHAERLLEITLARTSTLLASAGHLLHKYAHGAPAQWPVKWFEFVPVTAGGKPDAKKPDPRYHLAKTLSLIGSLLYTMNSTANDYMNQSAFLVGKLLAMMDELHKCYGIAARNGDIPNSLMGNGLLGRAAESPALAIAELSERSRMYLGWAKTVQPKADSSKQVEKAIAEARRLMEAVQPLADRLHKFDDLTSELTPEKKAHLFLGYLSPVLDKDAGPSSDEQGEHTDK